MFKGIVSQRLLALFVLGWLLFNFPLLGLLDQGAAWLGLPVFPLALFSIWLGLIGAAAWLMERPHPPQED